MITPKGQAIVMAAVLLATACQKQSNESPAPPSTSVSPSRGEQAEPQRSNLDRWIGRWTGPEGTYLSIEKSTEGYALEIADLDGPRSYTARAVGDHLELERNGKTETIRATNGQQTGMKWLQEKSDCLTIKPGEGFCRD